jgi:hypothetical protein
MLGNFERIALQASSVIVSLTPEHPTAFISL